jgi:hypothetical protein
VAGSSGKYVTTAPILVVEPFLVSLKVVPSMVSPFISSDKKAVTLVVGATPVALAVEMVLTTVGTSVVDGGDFMCC